MPISTDDRLLIEARIANEQKSVAVAYALWFFFGLISLHRFYLGRPISAILQILSYLVLIGFFWWLADAFLIPDMARRYRARLRETMLSEIVGRRDSEIID